MIVFQIYARDSARAAVVGEMWGVSRHLMGHNWSADAASRNWTVFKGNIPSQVW